MHPLGENCLRGYSFESQTTLRLSSIHCSYPIASNLLAANIAVKWPFRAISGRFRVKVYEDKIDGAPQFVSYFRPVLDTLRKLGGPVKPREVFASIADKYGIPDEIRDQVNSNGQPKFENRVAWARFYCKRCKGPRNAPDVRIICGARPAKVASVALDPRPDSTVRTISVLYPHEDARRHDSRTLPKCAGDPARACR